MSASRAWVIVGAAVAILPSVSSSESPSQDAQSQQYVVDSTGRSSVVTAGIGSCVHTGFWTADNAIDSCPGDTIKSSAAAPTDSATTITNITRILFPIEKFIF